MKKLNFKNSIVTSFLIFLFLTGCYNFDFVNQPYTADPNSSFEVQISVTVEPASTYSGQGYFGVMLPSGWTISDSILSVASTTSDTSFIIFSDSLSQQMSSIDPPPNNYYWWVGMDSIHGHICS